MQTKDENDEAWYEFEGCSDCQKMMEDEGVEIEHSATWSSEQCCWVCDYCGKLI